VINSIVNNPKTVYFRIDINTSDDTDAVYHTLRIPTVLRARQLNTVGVAFVNNHVIKDDISFFGLNKMGFDGVPD
jgi:hypothetical protein